MAELRPKAEFRPKLFQIFMIKMNWKTLAEDKMDIEKTADLKCISRLLVEKWHVDQIKMKITVSPFNRKDFRQQTAQGRPVCDGRAARTRMHSRCVD